MSMVASGAWLSLAAARELAGSGCRSTTASYFRALTTDPDEPMRVRLRQNAVDRWRPRAPIRIYHSPIDEEVPSRTCSCRWTGCGAVAPR
jgi:hypothetical protein